MGVREALSAWLSGSVVEISVHECPSCRETLEADGMRCPSCGEEAVTRTEYVSSTWEMG